MRTPMSAIVVIAVTATLALLLMPLGYLSGAAVALVNLHQGWRRTLPVVAGATLAVSLLTLLLFSTPWSGAAFLLTLWLPVWGLAELLRRRAALGWPLLFAALQGALVVVAIHLLLTDPVAWWQQLLLEMGEAVTASSSDLPLSELAAELAQVMTALVGASFALTQVFCLLIGRWWQAMLYNPGGFRDEFHALQIGQLPTVVAALLFLVVTVSEGMAAQLAGELLLVVLMIYLFQGLAVAHALVASRSGNRLWLLLLYLLLLLALPQMAALLAVVGVADNWVRFRRQLTGQGR